MDRLDRVVDYPARDMTITVEAGIRIERLAEVLEGRRTAVADRHRSVRAGHARRRMATNTSGPRRFGYGTFRDYVIGLTAMTAEGRVFHSGGRVVKNVAGYDLCKLLIGSLGTLAVVTQVTLKLKPLLRIVDPGSRAASRTPPIARRRCAGLLTSAHAARLRSKRSIRRPPR